jgi:Fic family protein
MSGFDRQKPYNHLPLLPPEGTIETTAVLRKTITAARALAQLNGTLRVLPNPTLLLDTVYLQEAKASSEVENIITTNDELYTSVAANREEKRSATKEVLRYKEALWLGLERIASRPFITTNLCIDIVQCIKQNTASIRSTPGTALSNAAGDVMYTPPVGESIIRDMMSNWERFVNTDSTFDPLVKMAILHYQFEAIHPFPDGNGRAGRILLLLYLQLSNLLSTPAIFLSGYINNNKPQYYNLLRGVTEQAEWEPYILYMLDMVEHSAVQGIQRITAITQAMERMANDVAFQLPKIYSRELIETLFRLPYVKRKHLTDMSFGTTKTVGSYLTTLEEHGFLKSTKVGKEKLYINWRLMDILEK